MVRYLKIIIGYITIFYYVFFGYPGGISARSALLIWDNLGYSQQSKVYCGGNIYGEYV